MATSQVQTAFLLLLEDGPLLFDGGMGSEIATLEPTYGGWLNFVERVPRNVEGLLRVWSERSAPPAA